MLKICEGPFKCCYFCQICCIIASVSFLVFSFSISSGYSLLFVFLLLSFKALSESINCCSFNQREQAMMSTKPDVLESLNKPEKWLEFQRRESRLTMLVIVTDDH